MQIRQPRPGDPEMSSRKNIVIIQFNKLLDIGQAKLIFNEAHMGSSVSLCVCPSATIVRTGHTLAKMKNEINEVCRFRYLSLNGVNAKYVLRDLDLLCEGKRFTIFISLKR